MQTAAATTGALPQPPNASQGRVMPQQVFPGPPFSIKDYGHMTDPLRPFGGPFGGSTKYQDNRNMGDSYRSYTQAANYPSHTRSGGYPRNQLYGGLQHRQVQQPSQIQGQRYDNFGRLDDASTQATPGTATAYDDNWNRAAQAPQLKDPAPAARPQRRDHFQRRDDFFAGSAGAAQSAPQAIVTQYESHQPRIPSEATPSAQASVFDDANTQARQSVWTLSADQIGGVKPNRTAAEFTSPADVRMALSVAGEFTFHYFQLMQSQPHMLHHFYCGDSQLAHGSTVWQHSKWNRAVGEHDIEQLFTNMLHVDKADGSQGSTQASTGVSVKQSVIIRANVKTLEAQPTRDGGIVMQATGVIETRDLGPRPFAHTIVMHRAPEAGSYVVLHDIFVFLDDLSTTPPPPTTGSFNRNALWRCSQTELSGATPATTTPFVAPPPQAASPAVAPAPAPVCSSVPAPAPVAVPAAALGSDPTIFGADPGLAEPVTDITMGEPLRIVLAPVEVGRVAEVIDPTSLPVNVAVPEPQISVANDAASLEHPPVEPPLIRHLSQAQGAESDVRGFRNPSEIVGPDRETSSDQESADEETVQDPTSENIGSVKREVEDDQRDQEEETARDNSEGERINMIEPPRVEEEPEIEEHAGMVESELTTEKAPSVTAAPWKNVNRVPPVPNVSDETFAPTVVSHVATTVPIIEESHELHPEVDEVKHVSSYAPNSYAAKLLQGVSTLPKQKGTVVKRARESAPTTPSTREQSSGNRQPEGYHSKAVWVAQVDQVTNAQIEQAVAVRLKGCLVEGRVVRIERMRNGPAGVIELDSEECVPILLERGLCLNGREVRIDLYKQGSPPIARSDSPRQNGPRRQQPPAATRVRQPQGNRGEAPSSARQNTGRSRGQGNRVGQQQYQQTSGAGTATGDEWQAVGKRNNRKPTATVSK